MKSKKKIIITGIVLLAVVSLIVLIVYKLNENIDPYSFEKRMHFSIPDYAEDFVELQKDITEEEEVLDIKFKIPEEKLSDFIDLIDESYGLDSTYEEERVLYFHPENTCENWDLDYDKLDKIYNGFNTRKEDSFYGYSTHRCHIHIFILKPENGKVQIYLSYNG